MNLKDTLYHVLVALLTTSTKLLSIQLSRARCRRGIIAKTVKMIGLSVPPNPSEPSGLLNAPRPAGQGERLWSAPHQRLNGSAQLGQSWECGGPRLCVTPCSGGAAAVVLNQCSGNHYSKLWNKAQGLDALGGCFALAAVEETTAVL